MSKVSGNGDDYRDLGKEQYKHGIFTFMMEWVKFNNEVSGVAPDISHIEPVAWLRELCDSLEEEQSKAHNTKDDNHGKRRQ